MRKRDGAGEWDGGAHEPMKMAPVIAVESRVRGVDREGFVGWGRAPGGGGEEGRCEAVERYSVVRRSQLVGWSV